MATVIWGISNIAAHDQRTAAILVADEIFQTVAQLLKSSSIKLRKEAVSVIDNVLRTLEIEQLHKLVLTDMPSLLGDYFAILMWTKEKRIVQVALETVSYLLELD